MGVRGRGSPPKTTTARVRAGSAPPTRTSTESSCHEPMEGSGSNRHGPPNVVSPAGGGWFDDPDQPKKKPAQSSRRSGAAICRPLRPLSEPLHDAVTPNRHGVVTA